MLILSVARNTLLAFGLGFLLVILLGSCGSTRNLVYMQGQFDTAKLSQINAKEPIIRKGDLLSIIVYSDNPEATKIFNQSLITTSGTSPYSASAGITQSGMGGAPSAPGYQVDEYGNIVFQGLGKLHVEGLTKAQLQDTLDSRLKEFLKNPYYNIRFLNYKFTMLGEINRPGIQNIPGEQINLLEAIAMSGDLTFYGRRDNVLIIRENEGKREWARLDLTKPEIMASPFFYMQQNDIVIIEPNKRKSIATDQSTFRTISLVTSVVSLAALIYSIFK